MTNWFYYQIKDNVSVIGSAQNQLIGWPIDQVHN